MPPGEEVAVVAAMPHGLQNIKFLPADAVRLAGIHSGRATLLNGRGVVGNCGAISLACCMS